MIHLSRYSLILLGVLTMSYFLPTGYWKIFGSEEGSTMLFYSPLKKQFVYRDYLGSHQFHYRDEEGNDYSRAAFEDLLPFLYYKTMEKKGLLPLTIEGQSFDKATIKKGRQGVEIKSRHLPGHYPQIPLYPLFNQDPDQAMLPFPDDVFRFTERGMEFINADFNRIDEELSKRFTHALMMKGFSFPATVLGGKTTNLKPFDAGYFVRDSEGAVFHIMRVKNEPKIIRTPIPPETDIRALVISENRRKEFYGLAITAENRVYLISYDHYKLIELPADQYDAQNMDFKLLISPLHRTVTCFNDRQVFGTVTDGAYSAMKSYQRSLPETITPATDFIGRMLFPFQLTLTNEFRGQAAPQLHWNGWLALISIGLSLVGYLVYVRGIKKRKKRSWPAICLLLLTGVYGLICLVALPDDT
ncbi:MAG: DUF4857 domain-containing protein [Desulfobulbaceae bacterium]|nr:DUF4857 domain-containing protein [Desulfobulbaceae bacterium]